MNTPNGQTPLDYLNEIAPQAQKKPGFTLNMRTVIFGAIIVFVLIITLVTIVGGINGSRKEPWERFTARLGATTTHVDSSSNKIKNSQLRSLNSDLKLYITNTQRDLAAPLERLEINPSKISKTIIAEETGTGMAERLENGRLNAKYDSTYAREMTYQLATILSLLQQLYAASSNPETRAFLETAYNNLQPTYESIESFSASNE